jgi:hypothetical protein
MSPAAAAVITSPLETLKRSLKDDNKLQHSTRSRREQVDEFMCWQEKTPYFGLRFAFLA